MFINDDSIHIQRPAYQTPNTHKHILSVLCKKNFIHIIRIFYYTPQRPINLWHIFQLSTLSTHSIHVSIADKLNEKWNHAWTLDISIKTNTRSAATRMMFVEKQKSFHSNWNWFTMENWIKCMLIWWYVVYGVMLNDSRGSIHQFKWMRVFCVQVCEWISDKIIRNTTKEPKPLSFQR